MELNLCVTLTHCEKWVTRAFKWLNLKGKFDSFAFLRCNLVTTRVSVCVICMWKREKANWCSSDGRPNGRANGQEPRERERERERKKWNRWGQSKEHLVGQKGPSARGDRTQRVPVTSQVYFVFSHCHNWLHKQREAAEWCTEQSRHIEQASKEDWTMDTICHGRQEKSDQRRRVGVVLQSQCVRMANGEEGRMNEWMVTQWREANYGW